MSDEPIRFTTTYGANCLFGNITEITQTDVDDGDITYRIVFDDVALNGSDYRMIKKLIDDRTTIVIDMAEVCEEDTPE